MFLRSWVGGLVVVAWSVAGWSSTGRAQSAPATGRGPGAVPSAVLTNPVVGAYVYNPYLGQYPMDRTTASLYLLSAHSKASGLGSGVLSGVRAPRAGRSSAAPAADRAFPGPSASGYFNRNPGQSGGGAASFNRPTGYFDRRAR